MRLCPLRALPLRNRPWRRPYTFKPAPETKTPGIFDYWLENPSRRPIPALHPPCLLQGSEIEVEGVARDRSEIPHPAPLPAFAQNYPPNHPAVSYHIVISIFNRHDLIIFGHSLVNFLLQAQLLLHKLRRSILKLFFPSGCYYNPSSSSVSSQSPPSKINKSRISD